MGYSLARQTRSCVTSPMQATRLCCTAIAREKGNGRARIDLFRDLMRPAGSGRDTGAPVRGCRGKSPFRTGNKCERENTHKLGSIYTWALGIRRGAPCLHGIGHARRHAKISIPSTVSCCFPNYFFRPYLYKVGVLVSRYLFVLTFTPYIPPDSPGTTGRIAETSSFNMRRGKKFRILRPL